MIPNRELIRCIRCIMNSRCKTFLKKITPIFMCNVFCDWVHDISDAPNNYPEPEHEDSKEQV